MKKLVFLLLALTLLCFTASAQSTDGGGTTTAASDQPAAKKPRRKAFRPTKAQITDAQTQLKSQNKYAGEATGRYNKETREALKSYQEENSLEKTGRLDKATLEKMGIELTAAQAGTEPATAAEKTTAKPKRKIFRASKDQINAAQRALKTAGMYAGEETGKLDVATRAGLKQYQEANGLKVTGTLNQVTLEKMQIELTETQQANAAAETDK